MSELVLYSKRCPGCQICPKPQDMSTFFGVHWEREVYCTRCRYQGAGVDRRLQNMTYLGYAPKLRGLAPSDIKEWYIPLALRRVCMERCYSHAHGVSFNIYITDGERFWRWYNVPTGMDRFDSLDTFLARHSAWEMIEAPKAPQGGKTVYICS